MYLILGMWDDFESIYHSDAVAFKIQTSVGEKDKKQNNVDMTVE